MKKILLTLIITFMSVVSVMADNHGAALFERISSKLSSTGSIELTFKFGGVQNDVESGKLYISGQYFKLQSPSYTTLYDGEDLWSANATTHEINVYTPDDDELAEINPISILTSGSKMFEVTELTAPASLKRLKLTPRSNDNPYRSVIITVNAKTLMPKRLQMIMNDGSEAIFDIEDIKLNSNINRKIFVFNKNNFPGYKLIDLR